MDANELLKKRRDRAIAIILGVKEREVDPLLKGSSDGQRAARLMRKVVLDQLNDFYDFCLDVVGSTDAPAMQFNPVLWENRLARLDRFLEVIEADKELSLEMLQELMDAS